MRYFLFLFFLIGNLQAQVELRYEDGKTLTYDEIINAYKALQNSYAHAELREMGTTDCGRPLHLFMIGTGPMKGQSIAQIAQGKTVILINNGIHPGESCGIDASIKYSMDLLKKGLNDNVLIAIIPVYNVGGALNRGKYSRANQLGPEEHGFRGNARHLDLNRDFIKADALNTKSFYAIFHALNPQIFIDTHTSNGADYQYTMTLVSTQKDKLNPVVSKEMTEKIEPYMYQAMSKSGWEMTPYVNVFGNNTPDKGFAAFLETPRYASGYAALFNTISFITEAHMLKPYKDRVEATRQFLLHITEYTSKNYEEIKRLYDEAYAFDSRQDQFALKWALDSSEVVERKFKGYEYEFLPSTLGEYERLKYYDDKPVTYKVDYYPTFKSTLDASTPEFYVLPQAWHEVVGLLQYNQVQMEPLNRDTTIAVTSWYIFDTKFIPSPYEGHQLLIDFSAEKVLQQRKFYAGDYLIPLNQKNRRFITSVLEPEAVDSYLRWNYFDEIFQQKEYFSAYVFEDTAEKLLENSPKLRTYFEEWKVRNPDMAGNQYAILEFIYRNSPYYEKEHRQYPVSIIESRP